MNVLNFSTKELSATEIAELYFSNPSVSDALTTGSILNVLALAGIVTRVDSSKGKSKRVKYKLAIKGHDTNAPGSQTEDPIRAPKYKTGEVVRMAPTNGSLLLEITYSYFRDGAYYYVGRLFKNGIYEEYTTATVIEYDILY